MIGTADISVQPSEYDPVTVHAGRWYRAIPRAGVSGYLPGINPVAGVQTCKNLLSASPPTLLEAYEIYSYSIGWGIYLASGAAFPTPPNVIAELALLVNDTVRFTTTDAQPTVIPGAGLNAVATGSWISDLVNPIVVGARDRLSLRVGLLSDQDALANGSIVIGTQFDANAGVPTNAPFASTISYRTLPVPGARRL